MQKLIRIRLQHFLSFKKGGCENFRFRNFAKYSILCFAKFPSNFAKHEIEIWANISQFCETRHQNKGNMLAILQERDDFLIKICKKLFIFGTQGSSNLNGF